MNNFAMKKVGEQIAFDYLRSKGLDPSTVRIVTARKNNGKWVWNTQTKKEGYTSYFLVGFREDKETPQVEVFYLVPAAVAETRKTIAVAVNSKSWLNEYRLLEESCSPVEEVTLDQS